MQFNSLRPTADLSLWISRHQSLQFFIEVFNQYHTAKLISEPRRSVTWIVLAL